MDPSHLRNRLVHETSLYLLQHAANPVDWYPWGPEALELAKNLDRPILLSIGYSACHWCHVMERECFEDSSIAALMNARFVCIKVDREERPDLDQLYMKALQGMTGSGGWPMTMFLTPDTRPFYGGTYFPPQDRSGMPGFPRVLLGVAQTWVNKREEVLESASRMVEFLGASGRSMFPGELSDDGLREAAKSLAVAVDPEHGGFGRAPKFPGTMALSFLMEWGAGVEQADERVRLTLDRMAAGGIRDHLGGGFHRYSVDREWLAPHFEKMLYDQALLAGLYVEASKYFSEPRHAAVAEEILEYILGEMTSPEGGFHSAQDADSEGEEGKYFVWSKAEVHEALGGDRAEVFCLAYDITTGGNFEGSNILRRVRSTGELAHLLQRGSVEIDVDLEQARRQLLTRRGARIAPTTDCKILTDWNALMISALVFAGAFLGREDFVDAASRALAFLRKALWNGRELFHVHARGEAKVPGFLDDYAFLGRACLDLYSARPDPELFRFAICCADCLLDDFQDKQGGGFHFTANRRDTLVARPNDLHDGAVPSGNSIAAELLLRLFTLTGEDRYRSAGEAVLGRFVEEGIRNPHGSAYLLGVAGRQQRGQTVVVVTGDMPERAELSRAALSAYRPGMTVIWARAAGDQDWIPTAMRGKPHPVRGARAYVCEGMNCGMPIEDPRELFGILHRGQSGVRGHG